VNFFFPFSSKLLLYKQGDKQAREQHQLGVWRSPEEFVQEAMAVKHPFDSSSTVSDDAKFAIFSFAD